MLSNRPWTDPDRHKNNLDFLRFFLAGLVIFSHSYPLLYGETLGNHQEPVYIATRGQATGGSLAVTFFFILSGFLITQSWFTSRGLWDYLKKRILRIYPGFVVSSLVCLLIIAPLGSPDARQLLASFDPLRFVYRQLFFYLPAEAYAFTANPLPYAVNGSAWTIKYEFWCYLLIASLGLSGLLKRRRFVAGLYGVVWGLLILQSIGLVPNRLPIETGRTEFVFGAFAYYPRFLSAFLAGAVFGLFRERLPFARNWLLVSIGGLILAAASGFGLDVLLPVLGTYLILYLGFYPNARLNRFGKTMDLSYGIYLYGYPVQQLIVSYWGAQLIPASLFGLALLVTIGLAFFSWHLVEKQALRLKSVVSGRVRLPSVTTRP